MTDFDEVSAAPVEHDTAHGTSAPREPNEERQRPIGVSLTRRTSAE